MWSSGDIRVDGHGEDEFVVVLVEVIEVILSSNINTTVDEVVTSEY